MSDLWSHALNYWGAGGTLLLPLAVISLGIWGTFLHSRDRMLSMAKECRELEHHVMEKGLEDMGTGPIATLLARVRNDVRGGAGPRSAFHARGDECLENLRLSVIMLGALTAVAPLMGLLGTVRGMIATFAAVSQISGSTGIEVADGISQALITTQFGLVIALPGVFGVSRIRGLTREIEARLGTLRAAALVHLEHHTREQAA